MNTYVIISKIQEKNMLLKQEDQEAENLKNIFKKPFTANGKKSVSLFIEKHPVTYSRLLKKSFELFFIDNISFLIEHDLFSAKHETVVLSEIAKNSSITEEQISFFVNKMTDKNPLFSLQRIIDSLTAKKSSFLSTCIRYSNIPMLNFINKAGLEFKSENPEQLMNSFIYGCQSFDSKKTQKEYGTVLNSISKRIAFSETQETGIKRNDPFPADFFNNNKLSGYKFYSKLLKNSQSSDIFEHLSEGLKKLNITPYSLNTMQSVIKPFLQDEKTFSKFPVVTFLNQSLTLNADTFLQFIKLNIAKQVINHDIYNIIDIFTDKNSFFRKTYDEKHLQIQLSVMHTLLSLFDTDNKIKISQSDDFNLIQRYSNVHENYQLISLMLAMDFKYANILSHNSYCPEENYIHKYITTDIVMNSKYIPDFIKPLFTSNEFYESDNLNDYFLPYEKLNNICEFPSEILSLLFFNRSKIDKKAIAHLQDKNLLIKAIKNNNTDDIIEELNKVLYEPAFIKNTYLDSGEIDLHEMYYQGYADFILTFNQSLNEHFSASIPDNIYLKAIQEVYNKEITEGLDYIQPETLISYQKFILSATTKTSITPSKNINRL